MKKKWHIHVKTLGFVVVLFLFSILLEGTSLMHPRWWQLLLFFLFQSLLTNAWLQYTTKRQQRIKNYLIASVFRFATALPFAVPMIFTEVPDKPRFIANFIVFYLLFVVFEVYIALAILQANSEEVNDGSKAL